MLFDPAHHCKWGVYVIRRKDRPDLKDSGQGNKLYYAGMTNNFLKRLTQHNAGKVSATKGHQWELVAFAPQRNRADAATLEAWMKVGDSRGKREKLIAAMDLSPYEETRALSHLLGSARAWKVGRELRAGMGMYPGTATREADAEVIYE